MFVRKFTLPLVTVAGGGDTEYSGEFTGAVHCIKYTKIDFDDTVDMTFSLENTGEVILTLTNQTTTGIFYPRVPVDDEAGADATLDGTRKLRDRVLAANDRLKCVVAQGGSVKTGTITLIVEG